MLRRRDSGLNKIDFVDIAAPAYKPEDNQGITFERAMRSIHAITADGEVVTDVEAFRRLYEAVGLGWVYTITKVRPPLSTFRGCNTHIRYTECISFHDK